MKKAVTLLLLIPVVALAQTPQGPNSGMDRGKMLAQMKQSMLPMMEQSLPEMVNTRQCVQATTNTAELKRCAEIMQAFQQKMMASAQPPPGAQAPRAGESAPPPPPPRQEQEIEWSQKVKDEIVQGLDRSIKQGEVMIRCLKSSDTPEQMDACMQQSGLGARRN
ncbi:MAG: hypothetical protein KDI27_00195 [Gammaproteobacteria bacterium]|nr:hypothetical protein [Gammaproteobacteria bacterium]MCB1849441.1 hypothetical protein [Gammaproteobacteria bacterium]MCP5418578.1 hypothetical protein [Chromatiaceae bacterium]